MPTQIKTIEQRALGEATARLKLAIEEAKSLETIQRIVAGIERAIIGKVPERYDTASAINAARNFNQSVKDNHIAASEEAEDLLTNELYQWRMSLSQRDEAIPADSLRRFCERTEEHLDLAAFAALTRFYRSLPHTESVQSKYDFAVTRLFASVTENERRVLRLDGDRLVQGLTEVFQSWGQTDRVGQTTQREAELAAKGFRAFVSEAEAIEQFESLISLNLFNRVREFKRDIGETFYAAEVTATAIECNVALANKFSDLLASEGEQIREPPAGCRGLSDLLSDTCSKGPVSELLNELQMAELNQQAQSGERLSQLLRLLHISDAAAEEETSVEQNRDTALTELSTPSVLPVSVRELAECEENKESIAEFLKIPFSPELASLDLATFLAPWPDLSSSPELSEKELRRKALSLILKAERMLRSKLFKDGVISSENESELYQLLEETQQVGSSLRELISRFRELDQPGPVDQLLHISNHLLGARLRVQSAMVRRGTVELARQELAQKKLNTPSNHNRAVRPHRARRRLAIAAVLLVGFATLTMRAFTLRNGFEEKRDREVRILNHRELPGAELLAAARVRHEILIGIVSPTWETATDARKREELQALLRYGAPQGINTVMLLDSAGFQKGSVSNSHLIIEAP